MLVFWQLKGNTDWPKSPAPLQPGQVTPAGPESAATAVVLEILKETKCFELLHLQLKVFCVLSPLFLQIHNASYSVITCNSS